MHFERFYAAGHYEGIGAGGGSLLALRRYRRPFRVERILRLALLVPALRRVERAGVEGDRPGVGSDPGAAVGRDAVLRALQRSRVGQRVRREHVRLIRVVVEDPVQLILPRPRTEEVVRAQGMGSQVGQRGRSPRRRARGRARRRRGVRHDGPQPLIRLR